MFKRLTKVGNSQGILIDKALLDVLGVAENGGFDLDIADGKKILLTPVTAAQLEERNRKFEQGKEEMFDRHGKAFEKLAK